MKKLNIHETLLQALSHLHIPQPNKLSALLLYKKREDLIRDLLFMKIAEMYETDNFIPYID